MFDVGLPELLVIILVALVVVGPKDLPKVVRGIARTIAKMRRMADEFMGTVNDYVRESELQELREAVEKTKRAMNGQGDFDDLVDPTGPARKAKPDDPEKLADAQMVGDDPISREHDPCAGRGRSRSGSRAHPSNRANSANRVCTGRRARTGSRGAQER
jgi:sec-independent protein translocase protein TatB